MLNLWGGRFFADLLPFLSAAKADVLCLAEVCHTPASDKPWLTYRDEERDLPQRANLMDDLERGLPDHQAFFCPGSRGWLLDGETAVQSCSGIATFVHRRLPIIGQVQDFVHQDFSPDSYGTHPYPRAAHLVRVFDDRLGAALTIGHMHGLRDLSDKADTPARHAQAMRFAAMAKGLHRKDERLVLCGDLNVRPGSETLTLLAGLGLTELVTTRGHTGTRTAHYPKPQRFADYMLVSPEVTVQAFDVVTEPAVSDHAALVLDLA